MIALLMAVATAHLPVPERFVQNDVVVQVRYTSPERVVELCGGTIYLQACVIQVVGPGMKLVPQIVMPHPKDWRDPYAKLMKHELGHVAGWGREHEK